MSFRQVTIQNSFWSFLEGLEKEYHWLHHNDFAKEFHQYLTDDEGLKTSRFHKGPYCSNTYDVMKRKMASQLAGRLYNRMALLPRI
jgi:hypothetical protein